MSLWCLFYLTFMPSELYPQIKFACIQACDQLHLFGLTLGASFTFLSYIELDLMAGAVPVLWFLEHCSAHHSPMVGEMQVVLIIVDLLIKTPIVSFDFSKKQRISLFGFIFTIF